MITPRSGARGPLGGLPASCDRAVRQRSGSARRGADFRALPLLILAVLLSGCAANAGLLARPPLEALPYASPLRTWTLSNEDAWLRHHMMFGASDQALSLLTGRKSPISDDLLRSLQRAIVLRELGDLNGSNHLLEWAEQEAERRTVRSLTRTAGSLIINDRVLGYSPSTSEMGMINYYRMMNYLALEDLAAAAVEARRLTSRLDREGGGEVYRCADGTLRYLAGLTFEAAGELNDALVALRRSEEAFRSCSREGALASPAGFGGDLYRVAARLGVHEVADSAEARYPGSAARYVPAAGEVLLVFERGFVAHLTEEQLEVPLLVEDVEGLEDDDVDRISRLAASIAAELTLGYQERGVWGSSVRDGRYGRRRTGDIDDLYFLRLAWPGIRRDPQPSPSLHVLVGGESLVAERVSDLSTLADHELATRRAGMLTRLVARGILKFVVTREMEKKAEEEGGKLLGTITGVLANAAANELERADTRSWSLLPDEISVARLTLPAGSHQLAVRSVEPGGEIRGTVELGPIEVRPGRMLLVNRRFWGEDLQATGRAAVDGSDGEEP